MQFQSRLAFIIPTVNRPNELRRLLESMESQSALPDETIIVDAGSSPLDRVLRDFSRLNIKYVHLSPPGLTKQKNAGIKALGDRITVAGYLDDDLVMDPGATEAMLRFWDGATADIGGAAFNIRNVPMPRCLLAKSFFGMDSFKRGEVMQSGYQAMIGPVQRDSYTDWLFGGATVWRRRVLEEFQFDEWFQGYSYLEDVDYSYRVSRKYRLVVLANARVKHLSPSVRKGRNYLMGKVQVINRRYFVAKHPHLSVARFYWGTLGLAIANIAEGIVTRKAGLFATACGNTVGAVQACLGRLERIDRALKD